MKTNSYCSVTAIGRYTPERKMTNSDLEKMVETDNEWIVKRTGITTRYISAENEFSSDMAIKAVQNLTDNYSNDLNDVDLVIASSLVPDHLTPSVSAIVAGHFGMRHAGTYDLHAACSGFAYGLITANSFITSGQADKILLITSETLSKVTDYTDRNTCILFGDAATAVLIERKSSPSLFVSNFGTDGEMAHKVYCSHVSSAINGFTLEKEHFIHQDGKSIYAYVAKDISSHIRSLLDEADLSTDDIDWFVPHSANLRLIDTLCERLGFSLSKTLTSIENFGNTSSSSIPLALSTASDSGVLKHGQKVLIYGFGGGLTYAGAIFEW